MDYDFSQDEGARIGYEGEQPSLATPALEAQPSSRRQNFQALLAQLEHDDRIQPGRERNTGREHVQRSQRRGADAPDGQPHGMGQDAVHAARVSQSSPAELPDTAPQMATDVTINGIGANQYEVSAAVAELWATQEPGEGPPQLQALVGSDVPPCTPVAQPRKLTLAELRAEIA
eukprot:CAMPEP_0206143362 /NCGR_PEP_ID=MMETSP1473-20131121/20277_1 /ASSEMBLY_ACC=CAM_ASM_001109 /TAXON_ID=1461547 /ORGANISM="Stichococcus sp, Strain RCC1054" /LENGTH=173 /DNA_ID=CAMNT_0053538725 /DNA_START=182 /DNA_END=699 /DNA_ORIENTATION=+